MLTDSSPPVLRTERGLTVAGTRLTLYSVMDYLKAGWPRDLIRDWLDLSDQHVSAAIDYIEAHREDVEAEYREVLRQAEESRRHWQERQPHHYASSLAEATPEKERARARLRAWKDQLEIA